MCTPFNSLACMQLSISTLESNTLQNIGHFNGFWSVNLWNSCHSNMFNAHARSFKSSNMLQMDRDIAIPHTSNRFTSSNMNCVHLILCNRSVAAAEFSLGKFLAASAEWHSCTSSILIEEFSNIDKWHFKMHFIFFDWNAMYCRRA